MYLSTFSPAKVNFILNVIGTRADGYHLLEMLNAQVDFGDDISIEGTPGKQLELILGPGSIKIQDDNFFSTERNLACRAVTRVCELAGIPSEFRIVIDKFIPLGAGLAGGSSNAAAALRLMNYYLRTQGKDFDPKILSQIALELGADVPFCLEQVFGHVSGIGEVVKKVKIAGIEDLDFVIVLTGEHCSTAKVFKNFDEGSSERQSESSSYIDTIEDLDQLISVANNDLHRSCCQINEKMQVLFDQLCCLKVGKVILCGSGSSFVLLPDRSNHSECSDCIDRSIETISARIPSVSCQKVRVLSRMPEVQI